MDDAPHDIRDGAPPEPAGGAPRQPSAFEVEVLRQLAELGPKKKSWVRSVIILGATLAVFIALGALRSSVVDIALIVGVLLVHETGHYLAMRLLNYQDVQMFFIPMFGAAVSGRARSADGWRRLVVYFAGPLPGIYVGVILLVAQGYTGNPMFGRAAIMLVAINGFNLLPVPPLDGGRIVQETLFSRHPALEAAFMICAAALLMLAGLGLGWWLFGIIGFFVLLRVGYTYRVGIVARELRREMPPVEMPTEPPPEAALAIIPGVRASFPAIADDPKQVAIRVASVWERMRSEPPDIFESIVALGVQFVAVMTVLGAIVAYAMLNMPEGDDKAPDAPPPAAPVAPAP